MLRNLVILLVLLAMMLNTVMAQDGIDQIPTETSRNQTEGWKAFNNGNYKEAIKHYTNYLNTPLETDAMHGLALSHYRLAEYNIAVQYFRQLTSRDILDKESFLMFARSLIAIRNFKELNEITDKYTTQSPGWFEDTMYKSLLKFRDLRQPHITAKNSRIKVTPFHEINSFRSDYGPFLHNGKLFIVSDRVLSGNDKNNEDRKYNLLSAKENGENLSIDLSLVKNKLHFGPISLSDNFIFYSATDKGKSSVSKISQAEIISLYPTIYYRKLKEQVAAEKPINPNSFDQFAMLDPFWDEKNQIIYYASDMPKGYGGLDLYYQQLNRNGTWSKPVNLGPEINTSGNERSPYVTDSLIYFASDGHIGYGKLDVFRASKIENGFTIPENLGEGINSNLDDFSFILDPTNADFGLFATNRVGGNGSEDIYKVDFSGSRAAKIGIQALDWETRKQVDLTNIKISDRNGARVNFERWKSGDSINLELFQLGEFIIQLNANGYKPESDIHIAINDFAEEVTLNFLMFPLERGRAITLFEDGFDRELKLSINAKQKMQDFYSEIKDMSYLSFTIIAHTDSRGTEEEKLQISRNQAELVKDYFGSLGLDVQFINVLGRGDKNAIKPCPEGVSCSERDHAQNRRIQIRFDDFFLD